MTQLTPWHEVERVKGAFTFPVTHIEEIVKTISRPDGTTKDQIIRKFIPGERIVDEVYMVYYPQGHSICVDVNDRAQVARLGLEAQMPYVHEESGQIIDPRNLPKSPKQLVLDKTARKENRVRGGLSTIEQEL